ncbi:unnamed protein product [Closterium sp. Naga37s-1]|nr:unnamed protein product [Closterium sp. Naga37s-1]
MMLLGFLLVLAMSCGPRGSEGARGRLLPSNENDRQWPPGSGLKSAVSLQAIRRCSLVPLNFSRIFPLTGGLSVQASIRPSVSENDDSGDSWAHLRVRDVAPVQRKLQQQEEQRNEKQQQLQAAESVGTPVEKQRMLTAVEEWKHQEAAEETAAQATPAEAMAAQEMAAQETAVQAAPAAQATPAEATPAQNIAAQAAAAVKAKVHEVTLADQVAREEMVGQANTASRIAGWAMAAGQAAAHKAVMAVYVNALRPEDVSRATKAAMEKALENAGKVNL